MLNECTHWINEGGQIYCLHAGPGRGGQTHGDRVVAAAMAVLGIRDRMYGVRAKLPESARPTGEILPGTLAERLRDREAQLERDAHEVWDDRTNADLAAGRYFGDRDGLALVE